MSAWAFLLVGKVSIASEGLRVNPHDPPLREEPTEIGILQFRPPGGSVPLKARNAAIISLYPGAEVPAELRATGVPLGRIERHWLVEGTPAEDGLALSLRWAEHPAVDAALPDLLTHRQLTSFNDPNYGGQWYLEKLGMEPLYERTLGNPEVTIAVIDGPTDFHHPDLEASVVAPYDALQQDDDPSPAPGENCPEGETGICDGHGTAVSGITNAIANNGTGIVGMCPGCSLMPIRLIGEGSSLAADIRAFEHAYEQDASVVNNSWGFDGYYPVPASLAEVINRVADENRSGLGAVVVFAAGNDDREVFNDEMMALPSIICVSAVDSYGLPTAYTNRGKPIDVAAPSATVSLAPENGITETFGGTSGAAPVVSGLVGWILSVEPDLTSYEIEELLKDTAFKTPTVTFNDNGRHDVYGHGLLDPAAIVEHLDSLGFTDEEKPKGCGCSASGPPADPVRASFLLVAAALSVLRRRSR